MFFKPLKIILKSLQRLQIKVMLKGEVHSRMAIYFLYANEKFKQRYVIIFTKISASNIRYNPTKSFPKLDN